MKKDIVQKMGFTFLFICLAITILFLFLIIYFIVARGARVISWEFLIQVPRNAMTAGGVAPVILGTFYLTVIAIFFALPLGLVCAIYLCEYNPKGFMLNIIKMGINNLAGVPSVVFGLFGFAVFVKFFKFGVSLLAGGLSLAILALPLIIASAQEALQTVPHSLREASLALGATKWETIKRIVLPNALPGIITGIILSIGRVAGETAPILFTAAAFYIKGYPDSLFSEVMALPYHIYALMVEGTHPDSQTAIAYGCSLILLLLVLAVSLVAIIIRQRQRSLLHG